MWRVLREITQFYRPPNTSHTCLCAQPHIICYSLCLPTEGWPGWVDLSRWDTETVSHTGNWIQIRSPIPVLTGPDVEQLYVTSDITTMPSLLSAQYCSQLAWTMSVRIYSVSLQVWNCTYGHFLIILFENVVFFDVLDLKMFSGCCRSDANDLSSIMLGSGL